MLSPAPVTVILGQRTMGNYEFVPFSSYRGKMTDFNIWNRHLSVEELSSFSSCKFDVKKPLLKWEPTKMNLNGTASLINLSKNEVCRSNGIYKVLLSPPILYPIALSICKILKGNLSTEGSLEHATYEQPELLALQADSFYLKNLQENLSPNNEKKFKFLHEKQKWKKVQSLMKKDSHHNKSLYWNNFLQHISAHNTTKRKQSIISPTLTSLEGTSSSLINLEMDGDAVYEEPLNEELGFTASCHLYEPPTFRVGGFCMDVEDILEEDYVVLGRRDETELPLFQGFTGRKITYSNGDWLATGQERYFDSCTFYFRMLITLVMCPKQMCHILHCKIQ